jgi:hypothetical protein
MKFCKSDFGRKPTEVDLVGVHTKNIYCVVWWHDGTLSIRNCFLIMAQYRNSLVSKFCARLRHGHDSASISNFQYRTWWYFIDEKFSAAMMIQFRNQNFEHFGDIFVCVQNIFVYLSSTIFNSPATNFSSPASTQTDLEIFLSFFQENLRFFS